MRRKRKILAPLGTQRNSAKKIEAHQNNYYQQINQFIHTPYQELDLAAINDESKFFWRFFLKKNMSERRLIIEFQRKYDLTNMQITILHWTGNLKNATITPNKILYRMGQAGFTYNLITIGACLILTSLKPNPNPKFFLLFFVGGMLLFLLGYFLIYPYRLAVDLTNRNNR